MKWLKSYLISLENVDKKSDVFRFPFNEDFHRIYGNKYLDNFKMVRNMVQAFLLIKKCIQRGVITDQEKFNNQLQPEFFIFAKHGIGNCYFWQNMSDDNFQVKIKGYGDVIDYVYFNSEININSKVYPLIFMFRNVIELNLKRMLQYGVDIGVPEHIAQTKRRSHLLCKDLWKHVKPVILCCMNRSGIDMKIIEIFEKQIKFVNKLDKKGDCFRYPTSYSLEYRYDNLKLDLKNIYTYFKSMLFFLTVVMECWIR